MDDNQSDLPQRVYPISEDTTRMLLSIPEDILRGSRRIFKKKKFQFHFYNSFSIKIIVERFLFFQNCWKYIYIFNETIFEESYLWYAKYGKERSEAKKRSEEIINLRHNCVEIIRIFVKKRMSFNQYIYVRPLTFEIIIISQNNVQSFG